MIDISGVLRLGFILSMIVREDSPWMVGSDGRRVWAAKSGIVLDPMIRVPDCSRLIIVPSRVCAAPPGEMVAPFRIKPVGFGAMASPAIVKVGGVGVVVGNASSEY